MAIIQVNDLTFSYDTNHENIFENVSFTIDTDWKLGFVARNGRGKTTFLNLLMGKYEYSGKIITNTRFLYFPADVNEKEYSVVTVDLMEKYYPGREFWRVCMELNELDMDTELLYREFGTLSYGERTRVMLSYLFAGEHDFLLLDEPTNHLDVQSRDIVKKYLQAKKGFILVSHEREVLDACVDHVLVINKTSIEVFKGNFSSWYENKERRDQYEMERNESLKKDIGRLTESALRTQKWAEHVENTKIHFDPAKEPDRFIDTRAYIGEKSRRMQMRRKNVERRINREIEEKQSLLKNIETTAALKIYPLEFHDRRLISLSNLAIGYDKKILTNPLNFEIMKGDRVAICGQNGCGKSTLLKTIMGEIPPVEGEVIMSPALKISYVMQSADVMSGTLRQYADEHGLDYTIFLSILRQLDFSREQFEKRIEEYSQGQKKKVAIAGSLCERAHLYIWDEPLNYIDVFSRMQIEKLLLDFKPTMIFVEHDNTFTDKIATARLDMKG